MAYQRPVHTGIWTNKKFHDKLSVNDKLLFVYLLTNNHVMQLGIYELPIYLIVGETALTEEDVRASLTKLEAYEMIKYSDDTNEVAILNYNKYSLLSGGSVAQKCFNNIDKDVKNKKLLLPVYENLLNIDNTYEEIDKEKQEKKAILEYAKKKIKECLEHNGLLDNNLDKMPQNNTTEEETITSINNTDDLISEFKRNMESDPSNKELYELKIKIIERQSELYHLNYDAYCIINELNYYDIANQISLVTDINQLRRCVKDLEDVLNNLDKWKIFYDPSPIEY